MLLAVDLGQANIVPPAAQGFSITWDIVVVVLLLAAVVAAISFTWFRKRCCRTGFTFIELAIAIAVVGVLAVAAFPAYRSIHENAIKGQESGVVGAVRSGLKNYSAQSQVMARQPAYPATLDGAGAGNSTQANPFFSTILEHPITSGWYKADLTYTGPSGNDYAYDPTLGTFDPVEHSPGYVFGWSFDEGSGTQAGHGAYAGTVSGATWAEGKVGDALLFDGVSGHVHVPTNDAINLTKEGTVEAWVNMDALTPYAGIIHKGDAGDFSDESYTLQMWSGNQMILGLTDANGALHTVQTSTVFEPGQWYHVAGTWDSTGMHIYVNGVLEGSNNTAVVARESSGGLNIGSQTVGDYNSSWRNLPTDGRIDEAQVYGRALSAAEIALYYQDTK